MESAGNSNQRRGGQRNGWTDPGAKWSTGPGPGVKRSTELFLAQDKGPAEKRQWVITDQDVVVSRHKTRSVQKGVYWGAEVESVPARLGKPGIIS